VLVSDKWPLSDGGGVDGRMRLSNNNSETRKKYRICQDLAGFSGLIPTIPHQARLEPGPHALDQVGKKTARDAKPMPSASKPPMVSIIGVVHRAGRHPTHDPAIAGAHVIGGGHQPRLRVAGA
jgi:hypothetical protein